MALPQQFANNAQTTLASICNPGDATISVVSATGFPTTTPYTVLIDTEYLLVTSGASTTTWGVSRAQEGSSAGTHAGAATVTQDFTLAGLQSLDNAYYPYWGVSGLTGAIQASRYVGATGSGTPGSGTFAVGDFVIIQNGGIGICTVPGSPGTWVTLTPAAAAGHIVSTTPGPPTTSGLTANLTSAVLGANSTDTKGTIIFTVSGSPVTGGSQLCTVNFASAYSNANYSVQVTATNVGGATGYQYAVDNKSAGSFGIWLNGSVGLSAAGVYNMDYMVIG